LTVESNVSVVKQAIELGAVEYLCKPFSVEKMVRQVEKLIGPGSRGKVPPQSSSTKYSETRTTG